MEANARSKLDFVSPTETMDLVLFFLEPNHELSLDTHDSRIILIGSGIQIGRILWSNRKLDTMFEEQRSAMNTKTREQLFPRAREKAPPIRYLATFLFDLA